MDDRELQTGRTGQQARRRNAESREGTLQGEYTHTCVKEDEEDDQVKQGGLSGDK